MMSVDGRGEKGTDTRTRDKKRLGCHTLGSARLVTRKLCMPDLSDLNELFGRLADGDRQAFTPVFQLLWPPTLRLCCRMMPVEADASDAAQAALVRILERANEYDRRRPALPWALAIASWECRTLRKRNERLRETSDRPPESDDGASAQAEEQRDLIGAAIEAMGTLAPIDRETLLTAYWDIASTVSGATLRKRRERALMRLRGAFRRLYGLD